MENERQQRPLGSFDEEYVIKKSKREYETGEATFEIIKEKTAVLIVDMLDEFVIPKWTPYWIPAATEQVPRIKKLIKTCRSEGVALIYTAFVNHPLGFDMPRGADYIPLYQGDIEYLGKLFVKQSVYAEIAPDAEDIIIMKPTYDAFFGTKLDLVLKKIGIETTVICGTMTNYCCGATARSAFMHGYNVVFGSDINSTDLPEMHEAELKTLRRGFAKILTCDEIIERLIN